MSTPGSPTVADPPALERIRVVLVRPRHPGNIGAAARAIKTMGLSQLWLVSPERFPDPEAEILAAEARDLLASARVVDELDRAIGDCALTIATSARERSQDWPLLSPNSAAERVLSCAGVAEAALVFGPENSGLKSAELYRCQYRSAIPTGAGARSLNLSHAVQVYAYAIRSALDSAEPSEAAPLASTEDRERLYRHLRQVLEALDFPRRDPEHLLLKFRALGNRSDLRAAEVSLLRGLLRRVEQRIGNTECDSTMSETPREADA